MNSQTNLQAYRSVERHSMAESENPHAMIGVLFDELLRRSDFVSIHCPLNDSTRHLLNAEKLKLMKPTALLINTARGVLGHHPWR